MPHRNTDHPQPPLGSSVTNPIHIDEDSDPDHQRDPYSPSESHRAPQKSTLHEEFLSDRRRRTWTQRPEPISLYAELRKTPEKLFVKPVYWSERHLDILGVRWHELQPIRDPAPRPINVAEGSIRDEHPNTCAPGDSRSLFYSMKALSLAASPGNHSGRAERIAIKGVLGKLWPAVFGKPQFENLHMIVDGLAYPDCLPAQVLFPQMTPDNKILSPSSMTRRGWAADLNAFIQKQSRRSAFWSPKFVACFISPQELARLHRLDRLAKRGHLHQSETTTRCILNDTDPILVGIFIGMAQRHFYTSPIFKLLGRRLPNGNLDFQKRKSLYTPCDDSTTEPVLGDVKLRIISHDIPKPGSYDDDAAYFVVYTATVKRDFLRRFHDPFSAFLDDNGKPQGLDIQYTRVPMWPVLGLRERLGKALGMDFVGPFDETMPKTYVPMPSRWFHDSMEERAERKFAKNLDIVTFPGQDIAVGPSKYVHPLASSSLAARNAHIEGKYKRWMASLDNDAWSPSDHDKHLRVKADRKRSSGSSSEDSMTKNHMVDIGKSTSESTSKKRTRETDDEEPPPAI